MRATLCHRLPLAAAAAISCFLTAIPASAAPEFVNGAVIPGATLDATGQPGANQGTFGFFSALYYDPYFGEWWALSDRGPGGGLLDYSTRLQRLNIRIDPRTGAITQVTIRKTIKFSDPWGLLTHPDNPGV